MRTRPAEATRRCTLPVILALLAAAGMARVARAAGEPAGPTVRADWPHATLRAHGAKGPVDFRIDVADTPEHQELGLMFVRIVPEGYGMLFPVEPPRRFPMWMKNTLVSLDMLFIGADGHIACVRGRTEPESLAIIDCAQPVGAVLEIAGGEAARLGLRPGDRVAYWPPRH